MALGVCGAAAAQSKPKRSDVGGATPESMLWVGNSFFYFNNSMHSHVIALVRGADPKATLRGTSVTISGSGMDWHDMASYFRPNGLGKYIFDAGNEVVFTTPGKAYDAVIVADCSQCPIHPQLKPVFHEQVKKQSAVIIANGARPVLFMTWAYKDKPEMTAQLAEQYTIAGNANDVLVIPAGLAFANVMARRPELELYAPDKRHPTLMGTYLAAAVTYAAVYKRSSAGNSYRAGLDASLAAFLQGVADDTVREYYAK